MINESYIKLLKLKEELHKDHYSINYRIDLINEIIEEKDLNHNFLLFLQNSLIHLKQAKLNMNNAINQIEFITSNSEK